MTAPPSVGKPAERLRPRLSALDFCARRPVPDPVRHSAPPLVTFLSASYPRPPRRALHQNQTETAAASKEALPCAFFSSPLFPPLGRPAASPPPWVVRTKRKRGSHDVSGQLVRSKTRGVWTESSLPLLSSNPVGLSPLSSRRLAPGVAAAGAPRRVLDLLFARARQTRRERAMPPSVAGRRRAGVSARMGQVCRRRRRASLRERERKSGGPCCSCSSLLAHQVSRAPAIGRALVSMSSRRGARWLFAPSRRSRFCCHPSRCLPPPR